MEDQSSEDGRSEVFPEEVPGWAVAAGERAQGPESQPHGFGQVTAPAQA